MQFFTFKKKVNILKCYKTHLSQFGIKIKINTTITYSYKKVCMNYLKIAIINKVLHKSLTLYYDRIGVSEETDTNKTTATKDSYFCH